MRSMANAIRALAMDAVEKANCGHPGMPMGMADAATVLFTKFLKFDPSAPLWPDRDRFVLSAGHGSMLLYALLYLTGYEGIGIEDIKNFRQLGSPCAGHPEYGHCPGAETTTGPLGQGLANAVGMALAERILNAKFGDGLVDHRTYVIASDGDLMEGISQEACSLAGHLQLNRLIVLYDDNGISIDGKTSLTDSTDALKRFEAMGWAASRVDGMDANAVAGALEKAQMSDKPVLIACRTTIGYGAPTRADSAKAHGEPLGKEEVAGAKRALDWPHKEFEIPSDLLEAWRSAGARSAPLRQAWELRLTASPQREPFRAALSEEIPAALAPAMAKLKSELLASKPLATRKASEMALEAVTGAVPTTVGGSADLAGSNYTKMKNEPVIGPGQYAARFVHYGVREHGMAAIMNGMALHGGVIPYSGTFLVFSDYARPGIRLAALMGIRVIHVMTHDSIGLGEDGPTHQPVEHLASLRAIPGLLVLRPADAMETAECWEIALHQYQHAKGFKAGGDFETAAKDWRPRPTVLALSRQALPLLRREASNNLCSRGAYVLKEATGKPQVTFIATGSEVQIALEAQALLSGKGVAARVVSMPSFELFEEWCAKHPTYRNEVLMPGTVKVAIEAASPMGWERYTGSDGAFVGMRGFGASAPSKDLYKNFGITAEKAAEVALTRLSRKG